MINLVKQLTDGFRWITVWHRSGLKSPVTLGRQKTLKRLTPHKRVLGSSPRRLTTPHLGVGHHPAPIFCASRQLVTREWGDELAAL
jgi:hypothetical protein